MKNKIIYHYHPETKKYIGEGTADLSPLDAKEIYLIPAFSTEIKPDLKESQNIYWNGNEWEYQTFIEEIKEEQKETIEEKKQKIKMELINSRKSYLFQTDWQAIKSIDNPKSYSEEIKNKRAQAREEINKIEALNNLTTLNKFKLDFGNDN